MKPRDPQKIERIYQATLDIVAEKGLAGMTMSKVGKVSGLGMGTIYTYFKSKEEIVNALFLELKAKHGREIYANQIVGDPFIVNFKRLFVKYLTDRWNSLSENHFIDQCKTSPFLTAASKAEEKRTYTLAITLLEQGKKELIVKNMDSLLLLKFIMGGLKETAYMLRKNGQKLDKKITDKIFNLCFDSIKA